MRYIETHEVCLNAAEIADRFEEISGVALHPTNVGNAAKNLGLDYIEVDVEQRGEKNWSKLQKRYSELDIPDIFKELHELAERRGKYI